MKFICPTCGVILQIDTSPSGESIRCKHCDAYIHLPDVKGLNKAAYSDASSTLNLTASKPVRLPISEDATIQFHDHKYPNIKQAIWLIIAYFTINIVIMFLGYPILRAIDPELLKHPMASEAVSIIAITALIIYSSNATGLKVSELLTLGELNLGFVFPAFASIMGLNLIIMSVATAIVSLLPVLRAPFEAFVPHTLENFKISPLGTIITLLILAPIVEEFLNRGIILRGLLKNYSLKKAIIVSAVMFGIMHLNPVQAFSASMAGVFLGLIYARTKSLNSCIVLHGLINLVPTIAIISTYHSGSTESIKGASPVMEILILLALGLLFAGFGIMFFIKKYRQPA